VIPLFRTQRRYDDGRHTSYANRACALATTASGSFAGIGKVAGSWSRARLHRRGWLRRVRLAPGKVLDVCTGNAWPERFNRTELERRRRKCRTLNEWDSQYQLQAKPMSQIRLDPGRVIAYDVETEVKVANRQIVMMLGARAHRERDAAHGSSERQAKERRFGARAVLQDEAGNLYWHRAIALVGELATSTQRDHPRGQVDQVCDVIEEFHLWRLEVETNGIGGHVPSICAVDCAGVGSPARWWRSRARQQEQADSVGARAAAGLGLPLGAHSVLAMIEHQMRDWNPAISDQPDDFSTLARGAIAAEPVRIGRWSSPRIRPAKLGYWRPQATVADYELEAADPG